MCEVRVWQPSSEHLKTVHAGDDVHVGDDNVVAGVPKSNFGVTFSVKLCEVLINLDSAKSRKTIGCLLKENGFLIEKRSRNKCKKDDAHP
jgi:hypothetical protein